MLDTTSRTIQPHRRVRLGGDRSVCILIFTAIALARVVYVSLYASALPFWDQWDELNKLFRPWADGSWHLSQLLAPHNEHRIALTRILGLLLFVGNGHIFDNLVECYVNALLYAGMWTLLYALLTRGESGRLRCWGLAVSLIALGVLPFDWENTLVGFQSQFYLMEIAAVAMVGAASHRAPSRSTFLVLVLLAIASLFTMAAGVLAAPAVCAVVAMLAWRDFTRTRYLPTIFAAMLIVTIAGVAFIPYVPKDSALGAIGLTDHVRALLVAMAWPLQGLDWRTLAFAAAAWLPLVIWSWRYFLTRQACANEIFAAGMCIWVLLQFLAIAHARGHGMQMLASRYMEIPAIGLICNLWLALQLAGNVRTKRAAAMSALILGLGVTIHVFWARTPADHAAMAQRHRFSEIETWHVRNFISGHSLAALPAGSLDLPYPDPHKLQRFLSMPDMRAILPSILLPRTDSSRNAPLSNFAAVLQRDIRMRFGMTNDNFSMPRFVPMTSNPQGSSAGYCALDQLEVDHTAQAPPVNAAAPLGSLIGLTGWVADANRATPASFLIELVGPQRTYGLNATTEIARPDVAKALHSAAASNAGYSVTAELGSVPNGIYRIVLVTRTDGATSTCDTQLTLRVGQ